MNPPKPWPPAGHWEIPPKAPGRRVYVSGPLSLGNQAANVREAAGLAMRLMDAGHAPFCPHLSYFHEILAPRPWSAWMAVDLVWLEFCECMIRIPGLSRGADAEVARMIELGLPVFTEADFWTWAAMKAGRP